MLTVYHLIGSDGSATTVLQMTLELELGELGLGVGNSTPTPANFTLKVDTTAILSIANPHIQNKS
jgi:hypothetical protein